MIHRPSESNPSGRSASRDGIPGLDAAGFETSMLQGRGPIAVEFMSYGCAYCAAMTNPTAGAPVAARPATPILLFDDECAVCRRMASWVKSIARTASGEATVDVRPIGEDPEALRRLSRQPSARSPGQRTTPCARQVRKRPNRDRSVHFTRLWSSDSKALAVFR